MPRTVVYRGQMEVALTPTDRFFDEVAERVSALLEERFGEKPAGWLNVAGAADHLRTTEDGIRALVKRKRIPHHRGAAGRILFDRAELDAWVRGESA
jgi:excisionase family DNA binding protein